eukprot:3708237-Pyramimonas_sp.AAC.1
MRGSSAGGEGRRPAREAAFLQKRHLLFCPSVQFWRSAMLDDDASRGDGDGDSDRGGKEMEDE